MPNVLLRLLPVHSMELNLLRYVLLANVFGIMREQSYLYGNMSAHWYVFHF
jgi:hypothetical protein